MTTLVGFICSHGIQDLGKGWYRGTITFGKWESYQFVSRDKAAIEAWIEQKRDQVFARKARRYR